MPPINRGYKTELNLNYHHRALCLKLAGTARFAYNWGLAQKQAACEKGEKVSNAKALNKRLNALKKNEFGRMYEVSKCAPQEALRDLDVAFQWFFKGITGYPQPKKRRQAIGSLRLTGTIIVRKKRVQLPVLGRVRVFEQGYLPHGKHIFSATVSERAGKRRTVDLDLSERTFVCDDLTCRLVLDRDFNAALNLKKLAPPTACLAGRYTSVDSQ